MTDLLDRSALEVRWNCAGDTALSRIRKYGQDVRRIPDGPNAGIGPGARMKVAITEAEADRIASCVRGGVSRSRKALDIIHERQIEIAAPVRHMARGSIMEPEFNPVPTRRAKTPAKPSTLPVEASEGAETQNAPRPPVEATVAGVCRAYNLTEARVRWMIRDGVLGYGPDGRLSDASMAYLARAYLPARKLRSAEWLAGVE